MSQSYNKRLPLYLFSTATVVTRTRLSDNVYTYIAYLVNFVHFQFNALWLAAFYYVNPLLVVAVFLIYIYLVYAQSFRKAATA